MPRKNRRGGKSSNKCPTECIQTFVADPPFGKVDDQRLDGGAPTADDVVTGDETVYPGARRDTLTSVDLDENAVSTDGFESDGKTCAENCDTDPPPAAHLAEIEPVPSPAACQEVVAGLQTQVHSLTVKLFETQNQVDSLLEEKRNWLANASTAATENRQPSQGGATGELRGRWLQAKALAETYKREKEDVVVKYAQSEQRRMQVERQLFELETKLAANGKASNAGTAAETTANRVGSFEQQQHHHHQQQLLQTQEALKAERLKLAQREEKINRLTASLDSAMKQAKDVERYREKEAERLCLEVAQKETLAKLAALHTEKKKLNEQLDRQVEEGKQLKSRLSLADEQISRLSTENETLLACQSELKDVRRREQESSEFIRRLTERNADLQTEHLMTLTRLEELQSMVDLLEACEKQQKDKREEETGRKSFLIDAVGHGQTTDMAAQMTDQLTLLDDLEERLARADKQIADLKATESRLRNRLSEEREQNRLGQQKNTARIRELVRELTRVSRLPHHQGEVPQGSTEEISVQKAADGPPGDGIPVRTPKSDSSSLQSFDLNLTRTGDPVPFSPSEEEEVQAHTDLTPTVTCNGDDTLQLDAVLAKLNRLQWSELRLTNKVEFLEDHCHNLTEEVGKKNAIIQHLLVMHEKQAGVSAVAPKSVDVNRERISRTGGIMASLYTSGSASVSTDPTDAGVYLEISQKLQNLLEDCLFKNITLKDNLSTLGLEISSLTRLNQEIHSRLCSECQAATGQLWPVAQAIFPSTTEH